LLAELARVFQEVNPFIAYYKSAREHLLTSRREQGAARAILNPRFELVLETHLDRRRYNLPVASEFAVVLPNEVETEPRDVVLCRRDENCELTNTFQRISRHHGAYLPLHYVLIYPRGNPGFQWGLRHGARIHGNVAVAGGGFVPTPPPELSQQEMDEAPMDGPRRSNREFVTEREYYSYSLFPRVSRASLADPDGGRALRPRSPTAGRSHTFSALLLGARLFEQWCCDVWGCVDQSHLDWMRNNQDTIRAELYSGARDALTTDQPNQIGKAVILPASYHDGDRFMAKCYQVGLQCSTIRRYAFQL